MMNEEKLWQALYKLLNNAFAAAGFMGNLFAESGFNPKNLQNSFEKKLDFTDESYTAAVDNGTYTNFIKDSAGYGLAQWTFWTRKQNLLNFAKARGVSIGNFDMQLAFLRKELSENYADLLSKLKKASSVRAASDLVLTKFEQPGDQSEAAKIKRAGYSQKYYDKYAGSKKPAEGGNIMAVMIGHASIDENGKIAGGTAGDQTGKEVCTRAWYSKPWICVIRAKDKATAEKIAKAMEQACANDKIGYDQNQRTTLFTQAKANGWDLSRIAVPCETDCSALVAVCVNAAGIAVSKDIYTGNEKNALMATGKFDAYTSSDYIGSSAKLKRGDILLGKGHTAIALSNGSDSGVSAPAAGSTGNTAYAGKGIGAATAKANMNIRSGAGTSHKSYGTISKGTVVEVLEVLASGWYKIVWPGASCGYAYTSNSNGEYYSYSPKASTSAKAESAQSFDKSLAGTYKVTASALNIRAGAGTNKKSLATIPNGKTVQCYGYYSVINGVKWLYVAYGSITGFCSMKYLKK